MITAVNMLKHCKVDKTLGEMCRQVRVGQGCGLSMAVRDQVLSDCNPSLCRCALPTVIERPHKETPHECKGHDIQPPHQPHLDKEKHKSGTNCHPLTPEMKENCSSYKKVMRGRKTQQKLNTFFLPPLPTTFLTNASTSFAMAFGTPIFFPILLTGLDSRSFLDIHLAGGAPIHKLISVR